MHNKTHGLTGLLLVRTALASLMAAGLVCSPSARADGPDSGLFHEFKLGILGHDQSYLLSHHRRESGMDVNADLTFSAAVPVFGGHVRPAIGGTVSTSGGTSLAYLNARWQIESPSGLFMMIGIGPALHNGNLALERMDRKALGSRVLFHIPMEIGYRFDAKNSISLYIEHVSNARLADSNEGMDNVGIRFGRKF